MEIYAMGQSWIILMTVLQMVTLTTLTATSINPTGTINYRQVKVRGRDLDHHGDLQQRVQAKVPTDRIFTGTNQPKTQKITGNRRPSLARKAQQHQQQYDSAISYLDWTPIVQHKESLETIMPFTVNGLQDYQQRQVRQSDAIVTFVTPPATTTIATHHNNKLRPKNRVQNYDNERDNNFQSGNHYQYVNVNELPEINNNKRHNVTRVITNYAYGAVDEHRKNSNFEFRDKMQEKNKPSYQNSYNNEANESKETKQVYKANVQPDEKNTERQPQSLNTDFEHNLQRNTSYQLVNTDELLSDDENNKQNNQIVNIRSHDQKHRESQHVFNLLKNESKSDVFRDYPNNFTTTAANVMAMIEHENSHSELYNIMYNTDAINIANEQRPYNYEDIDDENNDFYRDDNNNNLQQHVYANAIADEWRNSANQAIVDIDSKTPKNEEDKKFTNLKFDQSVPKQRVNSNKYVNMNLTAAKLKDDSIATYHNRRNQNDEREKIKRHRRQKPSAVNSSEINPTILATASPRQLQRKVQSSVQTQRSTADDETSIIRMLYDGQNVFGQKYNRHDHGHIMTPSNKQSTITSTLRVPVIIKEVIDGDNDDNVAEKERKQPEQGGYGYGYTVLDENVGMDFGQWERREPGRTGIVTGLYRVRLPDGRTQTVEYTAGPATGYRASVTYEGVQRHPTAALLPLVERNDSTGAETRSTD